MASTRDVTIATKAIQPLMGLVRARGASPAEILGAVGLDPTVVLAEEGRIPLALLDALWERAARVIGDDCVGLTAAGAVSTNSFGILSYLGSTSPTLGQAIQRVTTYFRLLSDASDYQLDVRGGEARLIAHQDVVGAAPVRQRVEFTVGVMFRYCNDLLEGPLGTTAVFLEHPAPADREPHRRFFGLRPRFSAGESGFAFAAAALERRLRTSDAALSTILEQHARRLLAETPCPSTTAGRLRAQLIRRGTADVRSIDREARDLGLSARTLQRRLREEGTSYRGAVEEARRAIACQLVAQPAIGLSEVAFAVGFSQVAPFHRAFKRWTGLTPAGFRRLRSGA